MSFPVKKIFAISTMPKRKNEQTLADKAFKKARDDELGRYLEGCLKNYKEGNMTSDDVTNAYW